MQASTRRYLAVMIGGFAAAAVQKLQQLQQTAAKALRQSEELNQQILDSSDDCIKVLDLEGQILFMSQGGQALLKIQDITPFLNMSWAEFWQGADRQAAIGAIALARAGKVCTFQAYRPTMSGEPKWWDNKVSPIRGADGQVERLLCISRDITDRKRNENERKQTEETLQQAHNALKQQANQLKQANQILQTTLEELQVTEEELRQQNEELAIVSELAELEGHRYQDLFNFAPDGYVVTDAQGLIQEANQAIATLVAIERHISKPIDPQVLVEEIALLVRST